MLEINKSTIIGTKLIGFHSSVIQIEEGTALVAVLENGKLVAKPSAGVAGEKFVGVAANRHSTPAQANGTFATIVPGTAPYTISLAKTPINAAAVAVYINGVMAVQNAAPTTGQYSVVGGVLTFAAADAGKSVTVIYRYALTQAEAALLFGSEPVTMNLAAGVQTTAIDTGVVYVDNFDIATDWATVSAVKLGANGTFTGAGAGETINALVAELPAVSGGYLGLMLQPS